jgi:hypothetical protein
MSDAWGFMAAVVLLAALAIAIGLRWYGFRWSESLAVVGQALIIAVFLFALVLLVVALAPSAPAVHS